MLNHKMLLSDVRWEQIRRILVDSEEKYIYPEAKTQAIKEIFSKSEEELSPKYARQTKTQFKGDSSTREQKIIAFDRGKSKNPLNKSVDRAEVKSIETYVLTSNHITDIRAFLTKQVHDDLKGVTTDRNNTGYRLATDLIGIENYLTTNNIPFIGNPHEIFIEFCKNCKPGNGWEHSEWNSIWSSASSEVRSPSIGEEGIKKRLHFLYIKNDPEYKAKWEEERRKAVEAKNNLTFFERLKAKALNLSKNWLKGFGTSKKDLEAIPNPEPPKKIKYERGMILPTPQDYEGIQAPNFVYKSEDYSSLIFGLKDAGWIDIINNSPTGSGKSHQTGGLKPDSDSKGKWWYIDLNHLNPSTSSIESNYTNLTPRHDGLPIDKNGNLKRVHSSEENITIPSNCHNTELFYKLGDKNIDYQISENKAPNPICASCQYFSKCRNEIGDGYGYLKERLNNLSKTQIRAHIASLPSDDQYNYSKDTAIFEEALKALNITKSIDVYQKDFELTFGSLESKEIRRKKEAIDQRINLVLDFLRIRLQRQITIEDQTNQIVISFKNDNGEKEIYFEYNKNITIEENLSPQNWYQDFLAWELQYKAEQKVKDTNIYSDLTEVRLKIRSLFNKELPIPKHGLSHQELIDIFGKPPENIVDIITIVEAEQKYIIKEIKNQSLENNIINFNKFSDQITNYPCNWLLSFLKIWNGEKGSFYFVGGSLTITFPNKRAIDIAKSFKLRIWLDATANINHIAKVVDIDKYKIITITKESNPLSNLTIKPIQIVGMGSSELSDVAKKRLISLSKALNVLHPGINKIGYKKYADELDFDGWWGNHNRGTNQFVDKEALALYGLPKPNMHQVEAEYRCFSEDLNGFEDYYNQKVEVEVIQGIGRQRANLSPDKQFTIYLVDSFNYFDPSILGARTGCIVEPIKSGLEYTPEAGDKVQQHQWNILQFLLNGIKNGADLIKEKISQQNLAENVGISQQRVSQLLKSFQGGIKDLINLLIPLYNTHFRKTSQISLQDLVNMSQELKEWLRYPLEAQEKVILEIFELLETAKDNEKEIILTNWIAKQAYPSGVISILLGLIMNQDTGQIPII